MYRNPAASMSRLLDLPTLELRMGGQRSLYESICAHAAAGYTSLGMPLKVALLLQLPQILKSAHSIICITRLFPQEFMVLLGNHLKSQDDHVVPPHPLPSPPTSTPPRLDKHTASKGVNGNMNKHLPLASRFTCNRSPTTRPHASTTLGKISLSLQNIGKSRNTSHQHKTGQLGRAV